MKDSKESNTPIGSASGIAKGFISAAKGVLRFGLGTETVAVLGLAIIIIIIPLLLISIFPSEILFKSQSGIASLQSQITDAASSAYYAEISSTKSQICSFMNSNYPEARATLDDISQIGGSFEIENNTCLVTVSFNASLDAMSANIAAYVNAVEGCISYYLVETDTRQAEEQYEISSDIAEDYIGTINALEDGRADETADSVRADSGEFFVYDADEARWDTYDFGMAPKEHTEIKVRQILIGYDPDTNLPIYETEEYEETVVEDAWYGHIEIPMYYDLSSYRSKDIDRCIDKVKGMSITGNRVADPKTVVGDTLEIFYNSYVEYSSATYQNGTFSEGTDNRELIFAKLLKDGTLMYVPISGLSSRFSEGEPGYSGDIGFNGYDGKSSSQIWSMISALRNSGVIGSGTEMWNCTAFAEGWFYEIYGVDALYGNGCNMVENLLSSDFGKDNFYRGSSPAPGGIFSVGSAYGANHVGCIDAVDYENGTVTFSDGNTNGKANSEASIRIKKTMSFEEFEKHIKSSRKATTGSDSGWITFANPKQVN